MFGAAVAGKIGLKGGDFGAGRQVVALENGCDGGNIAGVQPLTTVRN